MQMERDARTGRRTVKYSAPEEAHYAVPGSWNFSRFLANVVELEESLGVTRFAPFLRKIPARYRRTPFHAVLASQKKRYSAKLSSWG